MRKIALYFLTIAVLAQPAYALKNSEFSENNRIRMLEYSPTEVYTINTLYGYQTYIEFSNKEEIQTISLGDRSLWQIIPSNNRLFIRPLEDNVTTNMAVITNRYTYQFDLKSGKGSKDKNPDLVYVAKFTYPDATPKMPAMYEPAVAAAPILAPVQTTMQPPPPAALPVRPTEAVRAVPEVRKDNYNYTYSGPDNYAPELVYDDGNITYLKFHDMTKPLPQVTVTDVSGQEIKPVVSLRNGFMVINAVAPRVSLMNDGNVVYLYNEALVGGAQ